jgi:hypothetical protein
MRLEPQRLWRGRQQEHAPRPHTVELSDQIGEDLGVPQLERADLLRDITGVAASSDASTWMMKTSVPSRSERMAASRCAP